MSNNYHAVAIQGLSGQTIGYALFDTDNLNGNTTAYDNFLGLVSKYHPLDTDYSGEIDGFETVLSNSLVRFVSRVFSVPAVESAEYIGTSDFQHTAFTQLAGLTLDTRFRTEAYKTMVSLGRELVVEGFAGAYGVYPSTIETLAQNLLVPSLTDMLSDLADGFIHQFVAKAAARDVLFQLAELVEETDQPPGRIEVIRDSNVNPAVAQTSYFYYSEPGENNNGPVSIGDPNAFRSLVVGTDADEILISGDGYSELLGSGGDDTLYGGAASTLIYAGEGNDEIELGSSTGANEVYGEAGNDYVFSNSSIDTLDGGADVDLLRLDFSESTQNHSFTFHSGGRTETSFLEGGTAINFEVLYYEGSVNVDDITYIVDANASSNRSEEQVGGRFISQFAMRGQDRLTIDARESSDGVFMDMSPAGNSFNFDIYQAGVEIAKGNTLKTQSDQMDRITFFGSNANDRLQVSTQNTGLLSTLWTDFDVDGGEGNDTINGADGNDTLVGGTGNDVIGGGTGNDMIDAGSGDDRISSGTGVDEIVTGSGIDRIFGTAEEFIGDFITDFTDDDTLTVSGVGFVEEVDILSGAEETIILLDYDNDGLDDGSLTLTGDYRASTFEITRYFDDFADFDAPASTIIRLEKITAENIIFYNASTRTVGQFEMPDASWSGIGSAGAGWATRGTADFSLVDDVPDILWFNATTGSVGMFVMNESGFVGWSGIGRAGQGWDVKGTGDFTGDGIDEILWHNAQSNQVGQFRLRDYGGVDWVGVGQAGSAWDVAAIADFNNDDIDDILWVNESTGALGQFRMSATSKTWVGVGKMGDGWSVAGTGNFNGAGEDDILVFHEASRKVGYLDVTDDGVNWVSLGGYGAGWNIAGVGDYSGDAIDDVLWRNETGQLGMFELNGTEYGWTAIGFAGEAWDVI